MIAVMETYQQENGANRRADVLQPYMGGPRRSSGTNSARRKWHCIATSFGSGGNGLLPAKGCN